MSDGEFTIRFGGNRAHFSGGSVEILQTLETHFKHCFSDAGPVIASYTIQTTPEQTFDVSLDGGHLFSNLTREQVLFHLMQDVIPRLNGAASDGPVFHAAALARADHGLILCGESGSGKSSLAAWLTAEGFDYLTDEVIFMGADDWLSGLPRSITLKRGSAFIWQQRLDPRPSEGFLQFEDGTTWVDPTLFHAGGVRASITPQTLVFPRYTPNAPLQAQPLKPAKTLFHLLQGLANARNFTDGGLATASHLAKQVRAWRLLYSDLESASQWLRQITA